MGYHLQKSLNYSVLYHPKASCLMKQWPNLFGESVAIPIIIGHFFQG